jgi:hypothetical protein
MHDNGDSGASRAAHRRGRPCTAMSWPPRLCSSASSSSAAAHPFGDSRQVETARLCAAGNLALAAVHPYALR